MTAYEFTRFEADFTSNMKAQAYDAGTVEFQIGYNNPGRNFREESEYLDAQDMFMELTMGCNEAESIRWAQYWMANAIAYGIQTKNGDWRHKFLAANDLFNYLVSQRSTGVHYAHH